MLIIYMLILPLTLIIHNLPSLFIADIKHLFNRHARHWFRWVLSTGQRPFRSPVALQVYIRLRWMLRLKNPEQPVHEHTCKHVKCNVTRDFWTYHHSYRCHSVCQSYDRHRLCKEYLEVDHLIYNDKNYL